MGDAGALGVLAPFVGGTYYGSLVAGVAAAAESYGRRLVAIQTLDAAAELTVTGGDPAFGYPVSWDHVSGFVAMADAVRPEYLVRLARAGKPVVLVGHTVAGLDRPAVLPDNGAGIRTVVTHLIREHGCRRIAFTGHLAATDIRERYDAYLDVLDTYGLEPGVLLPTRNNVETGVTWTADDLLRRGRPDALVAATDRNAIAALQVLAAAGLACPDDILVTGFDDIDEASLVRPELASVGQPLDAMGRRAVDLLMRQLDGADVPPVPHLLPTGFVPRGSCGCTSYAEKLPAGDASRIGAAARERQTLLHLRSLISVNYTLNRALLHRRDVEPQDPSWLGLTPATAGSIALRGPDGELVRTPGWRRDPGPAIPAGPTGIASFPPVELLDAAEPGQTVFVVKAKVGDSDRGWLALVDTVENRVEDGREMVNQCAALLTIALDLRDQEQRLRREAQSDRLTGLPNRSSFVASLDAAVARRRTTGRQAVVLFLDLDGFKRVNDSLGHHTGDRLLVSVADRLRHCLRDEDVAARFGGDEFLVLLDDVAGGPVLDELVDRISEAICAPYHLGERVVRIGVSIGAAECVAGTTVEQLLQEADSSMYRAKDARRGGAVRPAAA